MAAAGAAIALMASAATAAPTMIFFKEVICFSPWRGIRTVSLSVGDIVPTRASPVYGRNGGYGSLTNG